MLVETLIHILFPSWEIHDDYHVARAEGVYVSPKLKEIWNPMKRSIQRNQIRLRTQNQYLLENISKVLRRDLRTKTHWMEGKQKVCYLVILIQKTLALMLVSALSVAFAYYNVFTIDSIFSHHTPLSQQVLQ